MRPFITATLALLFFNASAQLIEKQVSPFYYSLNDVFMVDVTTGYTGGVDGIYKTTNGGNTWQLTQAFVTPPTLPEQIAAAPFLNMNEHHIIFSDANNGISVGWNASGNFEEIVRTTDGGTTWTVVHYVNPNTAPSQPLELRLRAVTKLPNGTFITVGHRGRVLTSIDNGLSWQVKSVSSTKNFETISFFDNMNGVIAGEGVFGITSDGGNSWTFTNATETFTHMKMLSTTTLVASTVSGAVMRSTSGGQTWTETYRNNNGVLVDISFVDDQLGFICGNGVVLKTKDGGKTFEHYAVTGFVSQAYPNGFPVSLTSVHALSENRFFLTTSEGKIYYDNNGALPFKPISRFNTPINKVCDNAGIPLSFENLGNPSYSYQWLIDKVVVASTYNLSYNFMIAGTKKVSLVAYNGVAKDTSSIDVFVKGKLPLPGGLQFFVDFQAPKDTLEFGGGHQAVGLVVNNVTSSASYQLFRNGVEVSDPQIVTYSWQTSVTFTQPAVTSPGIYNYVVKGALTNECGTSVVEEGYRVVIIDTPRHPIFNKLMHEAGQKIRLLWYDNSVQETSVVIERRRDDEATYQQVGSVSSVPYASTDFLDGPLETGHRYFYRLAGVNASGEGRYSDILSFYKYTGVIYVKKNATGANDGTSWQNAFTSFTSAAKIDDPSTDIWVAEGTYKPEVKEPWILKRVTGVYGGFAGTETLRSQRDWFNHKTILSADLGVPGDRTDNVEGLLAAQGAIVDGFTIRESLGRGVGGTQLVQNCIIENNKIGVGISIEIANSIIRNNEFGIERLSSDVTLYVRNCIVYNNKSAFKAGTNYSFPGYPFYANYRELYNTIFYKNEGGMPTDFDPGLGCFYNYVTWFQELGPSSAAAFATAHSLEFMKGDDGILGNDDDIFHYPQPLFQDRIRAIEFPQPSPNGVDEDLYGNPRVRNGVSDDGPIEYLPDVDPLPAAVSVSSQDQTSITVAWPAVTDATVSRLWLERRSFSDWTIHGTTKVDSIQVIALPKNTTSYVDTKLHAETTYEYRLRYQRGNRISFPGAMDDAITKKGQVISTIGDLEKTYGDADFMLTATATSSLSVTYASSNASVATVTDNLVHILKAGVTTITMNQHGNGDYMPAPSKTFQLKVAKANQTITGLVDMNKTYGDVSIALTLTSNSGLPIVLNVANQEVATVSDHTIILVNAGTTTVNAVVGSTENYNVGLVSVQLTIAKASQTLSLSEIPDLIEDGPSYTLDGVSSASLIISYSMTGSGSFDPMISGTTLTPTKRGLYQVKAEQAGTNNYAPASSETFEFCIAPPQPLLTVNTTDPSKPTVAASGVANSQLVWFMDGSIIENEQSNPLTITKSGVYSAQIIDACSSARSANFEITVQDPPTVTGIEETMPALSLYPNPAESFVIVLGVTSTDKISVINTLGSNMNVYPTVHDDNSISLDTSVLSKGVYFVAIPNRGMLRFVK